MEEIVGVYEEPSFRSLWSAALFSIIEDMKMLDICNNALAWRTKQGRILTKYLVLTPPLRSPKSLTLAQLEISLQDSPMNWILCWTLRCLHIGEADWTADNSEKGIFYEQTRWALEGERESCWRLGRNKRNLWIKAWLGNPLKAKHWHFSFAFDRQLLFGEMYFWVWGGWIRDRREIAGQVLHAHSSSICVTFS